MYLKGQHARNKYYGKIYCRYLIRNNPTQLQFLSTFKKSDDLCDSFLQGVWYLLNQYRSKPTADAEADPDVNPSIATTTAKPKLKLILKKETVGDDQEDEHDDQEDEHDDQEDEHDDQEDDGEQDDEHDDQDGEHVDQTTDKDQHRPVLKLKTVQSSPQPVGRELLKQIKRNQVNHCIRRDYYINKVKQMKRGLKPKIDAKHLSLSNLKYLIEHDQYDPPIISTNHQ